MKKLLGFLSISLFIALLAFTAAVFLVTPTPKTYLPASEGIICDKDENAIASIKKKNTSYIESTSIPLYLKNAVVSVEDKRFYRHFGLDFIGIIRAAVRNIAAGEIVEGGSTITQQTARLLYYDTSKSFLRKIKEAAVAVKLDFTFEKDEILTIYLNEVYFGAGAYGVGSAANTYFSTEAENLSLSRCALLAGIITAPEAYCPLSEEGFSYAMERRDKVLNCMLNEGYITSEEYEEALNDPVELAPSDEAYFAYGTTCPGCEAFCNRACEEALTVLYEYGRETYGWGELKAREEAERLLRESALTVHTYLDSDLNISLTGACVDLNGERPYLSSGATFLDTLTGGVIAYYGSSGYTDTASSLHQPASTVKPLYLSYGIEHGLYDSITIVNDERLSVSGYSPMNHNNVYLGYVTLRTAVSESLNSACLRLFLMGDASSQVEFAAVAGLTDITEADKTLSFALGGLTYGVSTAQLAAAYSLFATGGTSVTPRFVKYIVLESGEVIYPIATEQKRLLSIDTASTMRDILSFAVCYGTASPAEGRYSTFGKTGTTDSSRDVWFAGGAGNIVAAVWVGFTEEEETGNISSALPSGIFRESLDNGISGETYGYYELSSPETIAVSKVYLPREKNKSKRFYTADETAEVWLTEKELDKYRERILTCCTVDKDTLHIYNASSCSSDAKADYYFTEANLPQKLCRHSGFNEFWERLKKRTD